MNQHTNGTTRFILYETSHDGTIARVTLNRPETRNAQHRPLLLELDEAFIRAEQDDAVRVVILSGAGKMFSSGHDMGTKEHHEERDPGPNQHITRRTNGGSRQGAEARMLQEWHYFFENTKRWRQLRKITIAQVHGPVFAAGLMLMWACDLIVAAEGTTFADVVGTRLGMCGVEYFGHPWEFGPRKTKELLLTGDSISAEEAYSLGMVSKIFPADRIGELTDQFAARIAQLPTMTALLIKEAVNQTVDHMGFTNAITASFTLHQLNHAHWSILNPDGAPVGTPALGVPSWRDAPPVGPAVKDSPYAGAAPVTDRPSLQRLLQPSTVAVVGATDSSTLSQTVASVFENPAIDAYVVNPKHPEVFGQKSYPSLTAIGRPIDTVFSLMSAAGTAALSEEAADVGVGGMVVIASGFAEVGGDGQGLQDRLQAAAARGNFPVVGPNGVGYLDITRHCEMTFLPRFERRAGGLAVVAHSGALLEAVAASSFRPGGVGLSMLISAGNEAVTDMADYLDFLVDHEPTKVIALALEKIRRPEAFFAAAARARRAGKPVIALKLGRTSKGRVMTQSHTGTVTGDSWVYDVAFRQAGIATAKDVDELVDRVQFLEQLPTEKWTALHGLGVLTGTGGFATMTADLAQEESIDIPDPPDLRQWVQGLIPSLATSNPLDATGVILSNLDIWEQIVTTYSSHAELDALIFLSQFADWDTRNRRFSDCLAEASKNSDKPFLLSPLAGQAGQWMEEYRTDYGIALGNGLRGTIRGLQTMAAFKRGRVDAAIERPESAAPVERPAGELVESDGEWMLSFESAMGLLSAAGISAAPFSLVHPDDEPAAPSFDGPYVVKLADVAHRTEHGAVLTGVDAADVTGAVETLRKIAARDVLPATVVLQPQLRGHGEAFIGLTGDTELGPMVAFGLGGVFVEVMGRVGGRLAPFGTADAEELVAEFDDLGVIDGVRGMPPWDRAALTQTLCNAGRLVAGGRSWIRSMDLNPLIVTEQGLVAVDCVCFVEPAGA